MRPPFENKSLNIELPTECRDLFEKIHTNLHKNLRILEALGFGKILGGTQTLTQQRYLAFEKQLEHLLEKETIELAEPGRLSEIVRLVSEIVADYEGLYTLATEQKPSWEMIEKYDSQKNVLLVPDLDATALIERACEACHMTASKLYGTWDFWKDRRGNEILGRGQAFEWKTCTVNDLSSWKEVSDRFWQEGFMGYASLFTVWLEQVQPKDGSYACAPLFDEWLFENDDGGLFFAACDLFKDRRVLHLQYAGEGRRLNKQTFVAFRPVKKR